VIAILGIQEDFGKERAQNKRFVSEPQPPAAKMKLTSPSGILFANRKQGQSSPPFCENAFIGRKRDDFLEAIIQFEKITPSRSSSLGEPRFFEAPMQDFVNTLVLICAAIAALGFGVVLAFWMCHAGFAIMRSQVRPRKENPLPAKPRAAEA
jgi:hypothetical protein